MIVHRPWKESDAGLRYLWWTSFPMFGIFLAFSPKTGGGELNWPVTAYLSGAVLAAGWVARQLASPSRGWRRLAWGSMGFVVALGLVLSAMVHRSDWFRPALLAVSGPATAENPLPLRRFDPTSRLRGWRTLAAEVDRLRAALRAEGVEPVLAATSWALPGELGMYCEGHPTVHNVGPVQGDRESQYDLWQPNPIDDSAVFRGRTFIIIGGIAPPLAKGFRQLEPTQIVRHEEDGQLVAVWGVTVCRDFQHLERPSELKH
jgi:hypothetical protein